MRSAGRVLALTLVLPFLLLAAPAAEAALERPSPELRVAYLVGLDIHTASGRVVQVSLPARYSRDIDTALLGKSPRGWVVAAGDWFYLVAGGEATRIVERNRGDLYVTELLSDDGRHVVSSTSDQADYVNVDVFDLDGTLVAVGSRMNAGGDVEAAGPTDVYVSGVDGLDRITIGGDGTTRVMRRSADLVDLDHDVVFVRPSEKHYERSGPTSLSDPGPLRWRADFDAEDISPEGTYVLGYEGQVRRMSDGTVVSNLPVRHDDGSFSIQVGWADERTVVHIITKGERHALGRCDVITRRCTRVVPWTTRNISLPTSVAGPDVSP